MRKRCETSTGVREWTQEEKLAYADWDLAEDKRIENEVVGRRQQKGLLNRRGPGKLWDEVHQDDELQQSIWETQQRELDPEQEASCIVVQL